MDLPPDSSPTVTFAAVCHPVEVTMSPTCNTVRGANCRLGVIARPLTVSVCATLAHCCCRAAMSIATYRHMNEEAAQMERVFMASVERRLR